MKARLVAPASALALLYVTFPAAASAAAPADTRAAAVGVAGDAGKSSLTPSPTATDATTIDPEATKKWKVSASMGTSFVGGLINSGTDLANPPPGANIVGFGPTYNPALDFTLGLGATYRFTKYISGSASYRLSKGFAFDDRGEYHPGNAGSTSSQLIDTGDLGLRMSHGNLWTWEKTGIKITGNASLTVPASRNSWVCNPLYTALGVGFGASKAFEVGFSISLSTGVSKPFYAYASPPRGGVNGACRTPLPEYDGTETLSGTIYPTSDRSRAVGRLNSSWAFSNGISFGNPHALLALAFPKLKDGWFWKKFSTSIGLSVTSRMVMSDGDYVVETATGPYTIEASKNPFVHGYGYNVGAGYAVNDRIGVGLSLSNSVPQLLYDPSTYYATWLPSTTISLSVSGSY